MFLNYSKKNRNYQSHAISKYKLNFIGSFQIKLEKTINKIMTIKYA